MRTRGVDEDGACTGVMFDVELAYDGYYGWANGTKLPSGEIVAYDRNAYGFSIAERNPLAPVSDDVYRTTLGMNARGQVTHERLSNGLDAFMTYFASSGQMQSVCVTTDDCTAPLYRTDYRYDDNYLNLTERKGNLDPFDDINQYYKRETFEYDDLHRLTSSSRYWRGTMQRPAFVTYGYSPAGNLLSKSDYAEEYGYGSLVRSTDNAGPHAVAWVRKPGDIDPVTFGYDENGNLTRADGKSIEYDFLNKPVRIENDTGEVTELFYGPNGERYKQVVTGSGPTRTTYYAGKLHERVIDSSGVRIDKDYVGDYLIIIDDASDSAGRQLRYLHRDRLGSIELMTDQSGQLVGGESRSFDAFGKPRDGIWGDTGGDLQPLATTRGFTAHEHLNDHQLIHMNGRAYDYNLGRFSSVDPVIQFPENSQSLNPYSYILNNPFSGTDPTGYAGTNGGSDENDGHRPGFSQQWKKINLQPGNNAYRVEVKHKDGTSTVVHVYFDDLFAVAQQLNAGAANSNAPSEDLNSSGSGSGKSGQGGGALSVGSLSLDLDDTAVLLAAYWKYLGPGLFNTYNEFLSESYEWALGKPGAIAVSLAAFGAAPLEMVAREAEASLVARLGCFEAGTLVATEDGFAPIERVEAGDHVWSYNEGTGEVELHAVVAVSARETSSVVHLHIGGEEIRTTTEHPFWVDGAGWLPASELAVGDQLWRLDGGLVDVEDVVIERTRTVVYNLEVENSATYFVAEREVLVHNSWILRKLGGGAPRVATLDASAIRFSQSSVNGVGEIAESMAAKGWAGAPIDVVQMRSGLVTIDNTRLLAAHMTETPVQAVIHGMGDALPASMAGRFGSATTWGEAVLYRLGGQNAAYRALFPEGSWFVGVGAP